MNSCIIYRAEHRGSECRFLSGKVHLPSCSSSSAVALVIASQAVGISRLYNISRDSTVLDMLRTLQSLGVGISQKRDSVLVTGVGIGGFLKPEVPINVGRSLLGASIILAMLSTYPFTSFIDNYFDRHTCAGASDQLPTEMIEVMKTFSLYGIKYLHNNVFPIAVMGVEDLPPVAFKKEECIASEVLKAAFLISCTNIAGDNSVCACEVLPSYTEWLLSAFGAEVSTVSQSWLDTITVRGHTELLARDIRMFPSTSYVLCLVAAAIILQGSSLEIRDVFIDKTVAKVLNIFCRIGGNISYSIGNNGLANICVRSGSLRGVDIDHNDLKLVSCAFPIVCVVCACSEGITRICGMAELELRNKRMVMTVIDALKGCGVSIEVAGDILEIEGKGGCKGEYTREEASIYVGDDSRIAIPFLILSFVTRTPLIMKGLKNRELAEFVGVLNKLGEEGNFSVEFMQTKI